MKVLHIIPAAFHYYDDIQKEAFELIEAESQMGVEAVAYTIEYQVQAKKSAPNTDTAIPREAVPEELIPAVFKRRSKPEYQGKVSGANIANDIASFDIIHVHAPIFGSIGQILKWKELYPRIGLVVTVYRRSYVIDFFTILYAWYNRFFLTKLFKAANYIVAHDLQVLYAHYKKKIEANLDKVVVVDTDPRFLDGDLSVTVPNWAGLGMKEILALKCIILYTTLSGT